MFTSRHLRILALSSPWQPQSRHLWFYGSVVLGAIVVVETILFPLLAVDQELWDLVEPMLNQARVAEIDYNREVRHLRRFAQARRLVVRLPRLRY